MDQKYEKVHAVSGERSSSFLEFGKRKVEGNEAELQFPIQKHVAFLGLNGSPSLAFQGKDDEKQDGDEVESEMLNNPIVCFRGKQHHTERDEGSPCVMETKAVSLPEDLVKKILSMIPIPDIRKVLLLNKSWSGSFSTSPDALVFQNLVKAVSARWKQYCPIVLDIEKDTLVGYDREDNQWQYISLGFERENLSRWGSTVMLRGAGSLICGISERGIVFVTNILTRTWKCLPSWPDMAFPNEIQLLPIGSDAYQVLLITRYENPPNVVSCQIYDSRMQSWTVRQSTVSEGLPLCSSSIAYLNGVLYVMEHSQVFRNSMTMLSYNVSDGTWTKIHHPFGSMLHEIESYKLLVCQNHVMVIMRRRGRSNFLSHKTERNTLMVYKLDPVSSDIREVARGPPKLMFASSELFASDNDCIYFGNPRVASSAVVKLNVQNREWSCLPPLTCADGSFKYKWATFSFQPGLNPFVSP